MFNKGVLLASTMALAISTLVACSASSSGGGGKANSAALDSAAGKYLKLAECPDATARLQKITGNLTVGYSAPLSGAVAAGFADALAGFKARFEAANATHEVPAIALHVNFADDAFTPSKAKSNFIKFMNDKSINVLQTVGGGQVAAVAGDQNDQCFPDLLDYNGADQYRDGTKYPWTLVYSVSPNQELAAIRQYIERTVPGGAKIAVEADPSASGQQYLDAAKATFTDSNYKIVATASAADPNAAAATLKASGANVLVAFGLTDGCLAITEANARVGWKPKLVTKPSDCASNQFFAPAGQSANGELVMQWQMDPQSPTYNSVPAMQQFKAAMAKYEPKANVNALTVDGWVEADIEVNIFKKALSSTLGLSQAGIMWAAHNQDYHPPLFVNGVNWKTQPAFTVGIASLQPFTWNATAKSFQAAGSPIDVSKAFDR